MNELYLNISKQRKEFKNSLGQANHFLVTALIGLDYIDKNEVSCPEEFSTSWNPKNKKNSIIRSRHYILKSSLAWTIDCLDTYLSKCNQHPKLINDNQIIKEFEKAGRSVNEKFTSLTEHIRLSEKYVSDFNIHKAMSGLAIQWRNNTMHFNAHNEIAKEHKTILFNSRERIKELFCGLDINATINNFSQHKEPTFKETTSLIRGVQKVVEIIDLYLLSKVDIYRYADDIINIFFEQHNHSPFRILLPERRKDKIINILKNNSFSDTGIYETSPKIEIDKIIHRY